MAQGARPIVYRHIARRLDGRDFGGSYMEFLADCTWRSAQGIAETSKLLIGQRSCIESGRRNRYATTHSHVRKSQCGKALDCCFQRKTGRMRDIGTRYSPSPLSPLLRPSVSHALPIPHLPRLLLVRGSAGPRPVYPALDGELTADVVIIGGGFTGLSAAAHLAKAGTGVALIEANRIGDGASGRNGGQLGTGQRAARGDGGGLRLRARQGAVRPGRGSEGAPLEFAAVNAIEIDFMPGQLSSATTSAMSDYIAHADNMATRSAIRT